jgi:hypothetical protein
MRRVGSTVSREGSWKLGRPGFFVMIVQGPDCRGFASEPPIILTDPSAAGKAVFVIVAFADHRA